jgi:CheY-like chemotaxis protein
MSSENDKQTHPVAALRRLLVVDDNEDMRQSMKRLLEHLGYEVRVASNGRHALEMQREAASDVLISDIFMPDTDGLETIKQFREAFPGMKIIAMSGGGASLEADYLSTASVVGADAILRKPFSKESLLKALEDLAPRK